MAFDRTKVRLAIPQYKTDKIIGTLSGTINVGASTGSTVTATDPRNTGFGDSCLFIGIFTTNNGATWNDMGAQEPNLLGSFPVFQTVDCYASCSPTGVVTVTVTNTPNPDTGTAPAYTVQYKIALIAKKNQGEITPLPIGNDIAYSSGFNYQKIHLDDTASLSVPVGTSGYVPIDHNLGYIPNVRVWENVGGTIRGITYQPELHISTTQLVIFYDNYWGGTTANFNLIYRIYLDS